MPQEVYWIRYKLQESHWELALCWAEKWNTHFTTRCYWLEWTFKHTIYFMFLLFVLYFTFFYSPFAPFRCWNLSEFSLSVLYFVLFWFLFYFWFFILLLFTGTQLGYCLVTSTVAQRILTKVEKNIRNMKVFGMKSNIKIKFKKCLTYGLICFLLLCLVNDQFEFHSA